MSGFFSGNTNLDDIFELRESSDPKYAANVPYFTSNGQSITERYYPLNAGGDEADATGFFSGSVDLNKIFAAKDSVVTTIGFGSFYHASGINNPSTNDPQTSASVSFSIDPNGKFYVNGGGSPNSGFGGDPVTGDWLPSGRSSDEYEFNIEIDSGGTGGEGAATTVGAAANFDGWTTADRRLTFSASATMNRSGTLSYNATFTIMMRRIGTNSIIEQTIRADLYLDYT